MGTRNSCTFLPSPANLEASSQQYWLVRPFHPLYLSCLYPLPLWTGRDYRSGKGKRGNRHRLPRGSLHLSLCFNIPLSGVYLTMRCKSSPTSYCSIQPCSPTVLHFSQLMSPPGLFSVFVYWVPTGQQLWESGHCLFFIFPITRIMYGWHVAVSDPISICCCCH